MGNCLAVRVERDYFDRTMELVMDDDVTPDYLKRRIYNSLFNPDLDDSSSMIELFRIANDSSLPIIRLLLERGLKVDGEVNRRTALCTVLNNRVLSIESTLEIIRLIVENGYVITDPGFTRKTVCLETIAMLNDFRIFRTLVELGMNTNTIEYSRMSDYHALIMRAMVAAYNENSSE
jgi:hypothetical protein